MTNIAIPEHRPEADILEDLERLCASQGYAHTLAFICWRENFIGYKDELKPDNLDKMKSYSRLIRSEISLLIGLMIKSPLNLEQPSISIFQQQIEDTERLLAELHNAMTSLFRINISEGIDPNYLGHGTLLREPFFYSGEAAYMFQYRDFSVDKYCNDRDWIHQNKGFSIGGVKKVIDAISEIQLEKFERIREEGHAQNAEDITLLPAFTFSVKEVALKLGCDQSIVRPILNAFSVKTIPCNASLTAIGSFNESNAYPFIPIGNDKYLMFQCYNLAESAYETPFFWMLQDKSYAETAKNNRGLFTERFSAERLGNVLGKNNIYKNVYFFDKKLTNPKIGQEAGEIDVLAIYADRAVILQAKSKKLTEAARKGNDEAIRADFQKAIQDAYDQGFECGKLLSDSAYRIVDENGNEIDLRRDFKEIFIFCTTSEFYPALAHQSRQFLKTHDHDIIQKPYVMDVFFLDVLCEMLDTPLHFFAFLHRRAGYAEKVISENELSVLSFHLAYNLWVDEEHDIVHLGDDFAVHVDAAMLVRREGLPGKRTPDGILTKLEGSFFDRIIKKIGTLEADHILELGYFLLEIAEPSALELSKACEQIFEKTRKDGHAHDFSMSFGKAGITVHSCRGWNENAANRLHAHCAARKYSVKASKWFGLALNPDSEEFIWMILGLNDPWQYSEKMEAFLKTMPDVRYKNLGQVLKADKKRKVGRNDPCICGSGKKDKKCCKYSEK